ncbi:MAG TPA: nucleotidyl transferase AbiEii/AbiGii toxin family protein [Parafilimonas sp.]|nr:nucleotidyl transferase AbiEii/AbiGii toxin family protein [Parafilimonas sp.]
MLHKESVIISSKTFSLIQELQSIPELKEFYLVGGTALALQLGHRNSIDIDLFTQSDFDSEKMAEFLAERFTVRVDHAFRNTLLANVVGIKVDFVKHPYPYLKKPFTEE